ncbi:DNA glycosylase AlkZ-like family protein [Nonomuraea jabiensis]|uniref:DNA glycosylase AlkZ-like family protein n=1 Tax=Nonomuraea jabiensis TaxID=882448 RepID=UPI0036A4422C
MVGWFGALQSQDHHPAKRAIGQRLAPGVTDADLDRAFDDGVILRTHVLRPTWHFVAPAHLRRLLELTAPRVHACNAYAYRRGELDGPLLGRTTDLIADAVAGGNHLTRAEIAELLAKHGILAEGSRLGHILIPTELERVLQRPASHVQTKGTAGGPTAGSPRPLARSRPCPGWRPPHRP